MLSLTTGKLVQPKTLHGGGGGGGDILLCETTGEWLNVESLATGGQPARLVYQELGHGHFQSTI